MADQSRTTTKRPAFRPGRFVGLSERYFPPGFMQLSLMRFVHIGYCFGMEEVGGVAAIPVSIGIVLVAGAMSVPGTEFAPGVPGIIPAAGGIASGMVCVVSEGAGIAAFGIGAES